MLDPNFLSTSILPRWHVVKTASQVKHPSREIILLVLFELDSGEKVNSDIYLDQILKRPLQEFWKESFEDMKQPIVMDDNIAPHKKSYQTRAWNEVPSVSSKFPWSQANGEHLAHHKHVILVSTSLKIIKERIISFWNDFEDQR